MKISNYSHSLHLQDGVYFSANQNKISYPEDGNDLYMQIEENSFWFRHRNLCIGTLVKKFSADKVFWDIGGGNGYVAKGLQDSGIEAVLVEPGIKGVQNALKRGLSHLICATLENAALLPNSIESAGLFDVIEHIEEDELFLKDIHDQMATSGTLYVTVPAYGWLWSIEDNDAGHYRRYSLASITKVIAEAGFEIQYSSYLFSILPLPIFLLRSLPYRLGIKRSPNNEAELKSEHGSQNLLTKLTDKFWQWELRQIEKGKKIPVGSSCLVVATKK